MIKLAKDYLDIIQTRLASDADALEGIRNNPYNLLKENEKALINSAVKHLDRAMAEIETLLTKETENVDK